MLKIYGVAIEVMKELGPLIDLIARKDKDLARQIRRAGSSVVLNIAEAGYSQGGNENARFFNAMGSANEVRACLQIAIVWNYVEPFKVANVDDGLDRIVATLFKLTR